MSVLHRYLCIFARRATKNMMSFRFILARQMVMDGDAVEYMYTERGGEMAGKAPKSRSFEGIMNVPK